MASGIITARRHNSNRSFASDQSDLNSGSVLHDGNFGDDAVEWEKGSLNFIAGFVDRFLTSKVVERRL
jgi:hypothetical protein